MRPSCTVMEIWRLKDNGVTSLTFWGDVTSSFTWPFDSRGSISYGWSIVTMRLSGTVTEIWCLKDNGVTSLTFWGHVTSSVTWPFDSRRSSSYWFHIRHVIRIGSVSITVCTLFALTTQFVCPVGYCIIITLVCKS